MKWTRGKRLLALVGANLLGIVLLAIAAEGLLRWARIPYRGTNVPTENAIGEFDQELGWSYIPNISKTFRYGANERQVFIDRNRIRVPDPRYEFDPARPSILFIGCSFTMGHGVSWEESFAGQVATMTGERLQVVNLGVEAYGTDQALLALERYLPRFNVRAVVYTFYYNHIVYTGNYDRRMLFPDSVILGTKPLFELGTDGRPRQVRQPALYRDIRTSYLLDAITMRLGGMMGWFPPAPVPLTRALIREMADVSARRGTRFLLVNWRWDAGAFAGFRGLGVPVIDTLQDAPAGWPAMTIPGDGHPDAAAHRRVAGLIVRWLAESGLLGDQRQAGPPTR